MKKALHVISTGTQSLEEFAAISSLIHSHVDAIHIREKKQK